MILEIPEIWEDKKQTLSVAMIVRDEETLLKDCLESVKWADEIIIVDTGSIDKTKEIALQYTDKVYDYVWNGNFSKARNFGLEKCTKDWILILDADERITDPKGLKILMNLDYDAYMLMQLTEFFDMISSCVTTRLWRNGLGIKYNEKYEKHETACGSILSQKLRLIRAAYGFTHLYKENETDIKNKRIIDGIEGKDHPNGNFYLGQSYSNIGEHAKAVEYLFKALDDPIDDSLKAFCCNLISEIYLGIAQANAKASMDLIEKSLNFAPNQNVAHVILGNVLEFNGQIGEAIKEFEAGTKDILRTDLHHDVIFKNLQKRINILKEN